MQESWEDPHYRAQLTDLLRDCSQGKPFVAKEVVVINPAHYPHPRIKRLEEESVVIGGRRFQALARYGGRLVPAGTFLKGIIDHQGPWDGDQWEIYSTKVGGYEREERFSLTTLRHGPFVIGSLATEIGLSRINRIAEHHPTPH